MDQKNTWGSRALFLMIALALLSFFVYGMAFSWTFAIILMASLVWHEYGHIWAMKRYGVPTKGIYFIPFVGGAAVSTGQMPSCAADVVMSLMGPIFGLALALVTAGVYFVTGWTVLAGAAVWMGIVNLFNLLPIYPLDGGRVLRCLACSGPQALGTVLMFASVAAAVGFALGTGQWLLWIVAYFAFLGFLEFRQRPYRKDLRAFLQRYCRFLEAGHTLPKWRQFQAWTLMWELKGKCVIPFQFSFSYPASDLIRALRDADEQLREPPPLRGMQFLYSALGYYCLAVVYFALVGIMASVPGAMESLLRITQ